LTSSNTTKLFGNPLTASSGLKNQWYQAIPEKAWWSRKELEKGNNPEDDFAKWFAKEMGNPQLSS
jgi:hypothetical protein